MHPHRHQLLASAPDGWFVKESMTLLAPDGQANVIFSSEPLDPEVDSARYAEIQGELLRQEFPQYVEHYCQLGVVFQQFPGYLRLFEWSPPDGVRVTQLQGYYAHHGRGFTCTATTPATQFRAREATLRAVIAGLVVRP